jgi:hypothetical protein
MVKLKRMDQMKSINKLLWRQELSSLTSLNLTCALGKCLEKLLSQTTNKTKNIILKEHMNGI